MCHVSRRGGAGAARAGVGGLVINDRNELLVIAERYGWDNVKRWKLPGGLVDPGEDLDAAACREVRGIGRARACVAGPCAVWSRE